MECNNTAYYAIRPHYWCQGKFHHHGSPNCDVERFANRNMESEGIVNKVKTNVERGSRWQRWWIETDIKVLKTARFLGRVLSAGPYNINSSHLSVPMPTMNNRGSTQLCQHSELLIHNHRLALVHSVGYAPLWGAVTFACLYWATCTNHIFSNTDLPRKWKSVSVPLPNLCKGI